MEISQGKEFSGDVWTRLCCAPGPAEPADMPKNAISFNKPFKRKIRQAFQGCRKSGVQIIFKFTVMCSSLVYPACVSTFHSETSFSFLDLPIITETPTILVICHTKGSPTEYNQSFGTERNE